jgi:hypothetical protein
MEPFEVYVPPELERPGRTGNNDEAGRSLNRRGEVKCQ